MLTVNDLVDYALGQDKWPQITSVSFCAKLPSATKNQCVRGARSVYRRYCKTEIQPILRRPVTIWNNQNFKVFEIALEFPILVGGKSKIIMLKPVFQQKSILCFLLANRIW